MKKVKLHIVSLFTVAIFLLIALATSEGEKGTSDSTSNDFEEIGYWKGNNKHRIFTFYIKSAENIQRDSIPKELWTAIKGHGEKRMNTSGKNTLSYYYLNKQNTPDVSSYKTYDGAYEKAMCANPIAEVFIQFNGEKGLIKNPEDKTINCR